jgi:hypothetical protein
VDEAIIVAHDGEIIYISKPYKARSGPGYIKMNFFTERKGIDSPEPKRVTEIEALFGQERFHESFDVEEYNVHLALGTAHGIRAHAHAAARLANDTERNEFEKKIREANRDYPSLTESVPMAAARMPVVDDASMMTTFVARNVHGDKRGAPPAKIPPTSFRKILPAPQHGAKAVQPAGIVSLGHDLALNMGATITGTRLDIPPLDKDTPTSADIPKRAALVQGNPKVKVAERRKYSDLTEVIMKKTSEEAKEFEQLLKKIKADKNASAQANKKTSEASVDPLLLARTGPPQRKRRASEHNTAAPFAKPPKQAALELSAAEVLFNEVSKHDFELSHGNAPASPEPSQNDSLSTPRIRGKLTPLPTSQWPSLSLEGPQPPHYDSSVFSFDELDSESAFALPEDGSGN